MKTSENDRAICCFQQNGEKEGKKKRWFIFPADLGSLFVVMIIISESPCDTWECIRSSIFFMHPSILTLILYLYLHWTYSWIISISFPLAPVKQRLAQVATRHLSDLDSWITASLSASREKRKERKKGKKNRLLFIRVRNSCIRLQTVNLCYGTIYHRSNGVKSKAGES